MECNKYARVIVKSNLLWPGGVGVECVAWKAALEANKVLALFGCIFCFGAVNRFTFRGVSIIRDAPKKDMMFLFLLNEV